MPVDFCFSENYQCPNRTSIVQCGYLFTVTVCVCGCVCVGGGRSILNLGKRSKVVFLKSACGIISYNTHHFYVSVACNFSLCG